MKIVNRLASIILTSDGYNNLKGKLADGSSTLLEMFEKKVENSPNSYILGAINAEKQVDYITYSHFDYCSRKLGLYLSDIASSREPIGIISNNRPEWSILEYATYFANCISVPIHAELTSETLSYGLFITKIRIMFVSSELAEHIISKLKTDGLKDHIMLERIILMDHNIEIMEFCRREGYDVTSIPQILFGGSSFTNPIPFEDNNSEYLNNNLTIAQKIIKYVAENDTKLRIFDSTRGRPTPEDVATYCFTSGTTGIPKAVEIKHSNFIYQIEAFFVGSESNKIFKILPSDVYLSYLPLSHILERLCVNICIANGTKIGFFSGFRENIISDFQIIKPTFITVIPFVLRNFFEKINSNISTLGFFKGFIFKKVLKLNSKLHKIGLADYLLIDKLIFRSIKKSFGGKLRGCICGGSVIDPFVIQFLQAVWNIKIFKGYGLTESLGANIISTIDDNNLNSVGEPYPTTILKLVPLNNSKDESSSKKMMKVYLKGYSLTSGYLQPSKEDLKILKNCLGYEYEDVVKYFKFDEEGFLKTGDLASFIDGKIHILGKQKYVIKTGDEFISPEDVETKIRSFCGYEDVLLARSKLSSGLTIVIALRDSIVDRAALIKSFNKNIKYLIRKKYIPEHIKIDYVGIITNFNKKDYSYLYTQKESKKLGLVFKTGIFKDALEKAIPNNNLE